LQSAVLSCDGCDEGSGDECETHFDFDFVVLLFGWVVFCQRNRVSKIKIDMVRKLRDVVLVSKRVDNSKDTIEMFGSLNEKIQGVERAGNEGLISARD
jgi:hypothetical protein